MIPLREQEILRQRFAEELAGRVRIDFFGQRPSRIYIAGREPCVFCTEVQTIVREIASLTPRITLTLHELAEELDVAKEMGVEMPPATVVRGQTNRPLRYFGMPSGGQFPAFIQGIIDSAATTSQLTSDTQRRLRRLRGDVRLQLFVAPNCPHSPAMARSAQQIALASTRVKLDVIEVAEFAALSHRHGIIATPTAVYDETLVVPGFMDEAALTSALLKVAEGGQLSAADFDSGPTVPLPQREPQQQQTALRQTASGLVLPR